MILYVLKKMITQNTKKSIGNVLFWQHRKSKSPEPYELLFMKNVGCILRRSGANGIKKHEDSQSNVMRLRDIGKSNFPSGKQYFATWEKVIGGTV